MNPIVSHFIKDENFKNIIVSSNKAYVLLEAVKAEKPDFLYYLCSEFVDDLLLPQKILVLCEAVDLKKLDIVTYLLEHLNLPSQLPVNETLMLASASSLAECEAVKTLIMNKFPAYLAPLTLPTVLPEPGNEAEDDFIPEVDDFDEFIEIAVHEDEIKGG